MFQFFCFGLFSLNSFVDSGNDKSPLLAREGQELMRPFMQFMEDVVSVIRFWIALPN